MNTSKPQPIRVGDKFRDERGQEWKCIESKPLGKRCFFSEAQCRFIETYVSQVRQWDWARV